MNRRQKSRRPSSCCKSEMCPNIYLKKYQAGPKDIPTLHTNISTQSSKTGSRCCQLLQCNSTSSPCTIHKDSQISKLVHYLKSISLKLKMGGGLLYPYTHCLGFLFTNFHMMLHTKGPKSTIQPTQTLYSFPNKYDIICKQQNH